MEEQELIPHLFRTEFRKITAVLCKHFGIGFMESAADIASATFLSALENWPYKGVPPNPVAWLYTVAKNKARNHINRTRLFNSRVAGDLIESATLHEEPEIDLSEQNITDSQLQMLFALCHPCISAEAQVGLSLRILCGFGIDEIANAFLTNRETINKRLYRAREKLRLEKVQITVPAGTEVEARLDNVLTTLYLLFNEGYYSESSDDILREDLCLEAMRLTRLLLDFEPTHLPPVNALLALMCFHSSRFAARKNGQGEMILYQEQDETQWDQALIAKGAYLLNQAAKGEKISKYHLEATIAYWHTVKADSPEKWETILQLYNRLLQIEYSPIAALNRTYALSKAYNWREAIIEAEKLQLTHNHYYYILLGELYSNHNSARAREHFQLAYNMAKTQADKKSILRKLDALVLNKIKRIKG